MDESKTEPPTTPQPNSNVDASPVQSPPPSEAQPVPPQQPNASVSPVTSPTPTSATTPPATVTPPPTKKTGRTKVLISVIIVVVLIAGSIGAYGYHHSRVKPVAARVKIGVLLAFSGGSSSMGYGAMKGIQLAKQELNATNVDLVTADGQCSPTVSPGAFKYLISQHVVAVIGENCSSATLPLLPIADAYHMVLISPSASSPLLSIAGDYFFRTVPSDKGQGAFLATAMYKAGIRRAAVFYTDEPYGSAIQAIFAQQFEALGGKVVAAVSAPSSSISVGTEIAAIKAADPDGLAIVTNSTVSSTAVMQQSRAAGITVPFYGGDNLYDNTIITNNGAAAEGLHVVTFPTGTEAFKQALLDQYNVSDQLYAAPEAYDAFHALDIAIQRGATNSVEVKNMLPSIKFNGASGYISFDKYGDVPYQNYKYALLVVKNGEFQPVNL
jgi:branched-chain amino acid transport system substrate-binding protein